MAAPESHARLALIDPTLHAAGWTKELIRREETPGAVEIVGGRPRRAGTGRTDYTLRIKVALDAQPIAVAVVEAKRADAAPTRGLDQAKEYAREYARSAARLHVPFVYSTNGHQWVEFDATTGLTTAPACATSWQRSAEWHRRLRPASTSWIAWRSGRSTRPFRPRMRLHSGIPSAPPSERACPGPPRRQQTTGSRRSHPFETAPSTSAQNRPMDATDGEAAAKAVRPSTFYVVRGNGSLHMAGAGALSPESFEGVLYPDLLIQVDPDPTLLSVEYLALAWRSRRIRHQVEARLRTSAGIHKINLANLSTVGVPTPPLAEQRRIAARLREQLAEIDRAKAALEAQRSAIIALPVALLREVFGADGPAPGRMR